MKPKICAVFDIDDTLYLERDYVRSGFAAVGHWAARWLALDDFGEQCWARFLAGDRQSIFNLALSASGIEATPELLSALIETYRTHQPTIALAPDADKALNAISRIASLAVITDGPASSQSRKAEALGLSAFAAPIILTEVLGKGFHKPHPRAFELVSKRCPATLYVYVADNPLKDFAAPKQLGWLTVRVRRPGGLHHAVQNAPAVPDHEMCDCSSLPDLLAAL